MQQLKERISDIENDISLELLLNLEKAQEVLYSIRDELFSETKPNVEEYQYRYNRYELFASVVSDYIALSEQNAKAIEKELESIKCAISKR